MTGDADRDTADMRGAHAQRNTGRAPLATLAHLVTLIVLACTLPSAASANAANAANAAVAQTHATSATAAASPTHAASAASANVRQPATIRAHAAATTARGSQQAIARRVVRDVLHAKTARTRTRALLRLMNAVGIGVTSASGKPLVTAPEVGGARWFHLYEAELRGLGDQLARGQQVTLNDLSATLARAGITLDDAGTQPLPASVLGDALADATRWAAKHPRSPQALTPLVLRELGRSHSGPQHDLAKAPSAPTLDALQAWLTAASLVIPAMRNASGTYPKQPTPARAAAARADVAALCKRYTDATERSAKARAKQYRKQYGSAGGWVANKADGKLRSSIIKSAKKRIHALATDVVRTKLPSWMKTAASKAQAVAKKAAVLGKALHDLLIAYSLDVRSLHERLDGHWSHGDGASGQPVVFETRATMLDDYGGVAVKCGALAGFKFPPKGPVEGVPVAWTSSGGNLAAMGTLDCGMPCVNTTGKDGVARVTLTPHAEAMPGVGPEFEEIGQVDALPLYQQAAGATAFIGGIAQFVVPKTASTMWTVRRHQLGGLTLRYRVRSNADRSWSSASAVRAGDHTEHRDLALIGEIPLVLDGPQAGSGTAPLRWERLQWRTTDHDTLPDLMSGCRFDTQHTYRPGSPGSASVAALQLGAPRADGSRDVALRLTVGGITEHEQVTQQTTEGPCPAFDEDRDTKRVFNAWATELHPGAHYTGDGALQVALGGAWERGGDVDPTFGSVIARRTVERIVDAPGGARHWVEEFELLAR